MIFDSCFFIYSLFLYCFTSLVHHFEGFIDHFTNQSKSNERNTSQHIEPSTTTQRLTNIPRRLIIVLKAAGRRVNTETFTGAS